MSTDQCDNPYDGPSAEGWDALAIAAEVRGAQRLLRYQWVAPLVAGRGTVLDAGCRDGRGAALLADLGSEVVAVDGAAVVEVARASTTGSVRFEPGHLTSLPARDSSFGAVLCLGGLALADDEAVALKELLRVLAPEGLLVVAAPPDRPSSAQLLAYDVGEALSAAGLEVSVCSERSWLSIGIWGDGGGDDPTLTLSPSTGGTPTDALVIASSGRLPDPAPLGVTVTDVGVRRLDLLASSVNRLLATYDLRMAQAERHSREVAELQARLSDRELALASQPEVLASMAEGQRALDEARGARDEAEAARDEAQRVRGEARSEIQMARAELAGRDDELVRVRAAHDAAAKAASDLRGSTSWRFTAPGRWLSGLLRRTERG